jgi:hypothetical protein
MWEHKEQILTGFPWQALAKENDSFDYSFTLFSRLAGFASSLFSFFAFVAALPLYIVMDNGVCQTLPAP